jgi:hypothetical protein
MNKLKKNVKVGKNVKKKIKENRLVMYNEK